MKDFGDLTKILRMNKLRDISNLGIASQSSLSQWSKKDDPQRATQDNTWDYAFHTNRDEVSWWQIDFERFYPVDYILVENRRNDRYQKESSNISIHCECADGEVIVYRSNMVYGALPSQIPLIVPIGDIAPIRSIRIQKTEAGYLHLSRVRILCDETIINKFAGAAPTFIAKNDDGLGERLKAMMNAMLMAKIFDGRFYFNWPRLQRTAEVMKMQSVETVESMFSEDFIERYHVDYNTMSRMKIGEFHELHEDESFEDRLERYDGVVIRQNLSPIHKTAIKKKSNSGTYTYPQIFEAIGFSDEIAKAVDAAKRVPMKAGTIALHLRAGDVIYGPPRVVGRFAAKCFPFPIVFEFIEEMKRRKISVLVFGQDQNLLSYIKKHFEVPLAQDYLEEFSPAGVSMFEICLMSRCEQIYAGGSGFAHVASWRMGAPIRSLYNHFERQSARDVIYKHVTGNENTPEISALQKAFACWTAIYLYADALARTELDWTFVNFARQFDPENDLYRLTYACSLYVDDPVTAENVLGECLKSRLRGPRFGNYNSIFYTLGSVNQQGGTSVPNSWVGELDKAARGRWPAAAFCMTMIRRTERKNAEAAHYEQLFKTSDLDTYEELTEFLEVGSSSCA